MFSTYALIVRRSALAASRIALPSSLLQRISSTARVLALLFSVLTSDAPSVGGRLMVLPDKALASESGHPISHPVASRQLLRIARDLTDYANAVSRKSLSGRYKPFFL